jgi:tyrosinase
MSTPETIARKIWELFTTNRAQQRKQHRKKDGAMLVFSPFNTEHAALAEKVCREFEKAMKQSANEEAGYQAAIALFESLLQTENPDLLYYAFETFLVHHHGELKVIIPSLIAREPELVVPSSSSGLETVEIAVGSTEETKVDWFREDPSLNEHHGHWHIVYSNRRVRDRQGEMFFYMHQQMIARYDADRLSENVAPVKPYNNLQQQPVKVGYAAGEDVRLSNLIGSGREPNAPIPNGGDQQVQDLGDAEQDINNGYYNPADQYNEKAETDAMNKLGSTIEANPQGDNSRSYTNYHGNGHGYIGAINNGVMFYTQTAVRDVVFWEWHKGVDDLFFKWQEKLPGDRFNKQPPKVRLRKSFDADNKPFSADLILCLSKDIPSLGGMSVAEVCNIAFGGDNWNKEFAVGEATFKDGQGNEHIIKTVDTLSTFMKTGEIDYSDDAGTALTFMYPYLHHDEFGYVLRLENTSMLEQMVTVRIFLVPEESAEDRRAWIEMDKCLYTLGAADKHVIYRNDTESSVIRKPAVKDPANYNRSFDPMNMPIDDRQCGCGWPYHMLLPKGKSEGKGMPFRLMVMITDAKFDLVSKEPDCGSLSFCGARTNAYPDKRPLGYPFNRKFEGNGKAIQNAIASNDNMMCRTIYIKHAGA